jgi:fused signal recognition particle receptor
MDSTLIIALVAVAIVVGALVLGFSRKRELPKQATPLPPPAPMAPAATAGGAAKAASGGTAKSAAKGAATGTAKAPAVRPATPSDEELEGPDLQEVESAPKPLSAAPPPFRGAKESVRPPVDDVTALRKGLASTRGGFIARLSRLFSGKREFDPALLEQIEEVLITADIGMKTSQRLLQKLRERMSKKELTDEDRVWSAIREEARAILADSRGTLSLKHKPAVILVVGVNGVGKTTTTGKLGSRLASQGKKVLLVAADTFRAAAVLQLEVWGKRIGCPVARGKDNADPSSVVFDAIKQAEIEGRDVVLVDTAGRLHTKAPLMEELRKIGRTVEKALGHPADEVLLVLDSTNGQNALQQASMFKDALSVTGIALTKLDGTAKGGVVLGIVDEQKLPIRYIGIGERVEDLREFEPESFVAALFERTDSESPAA